jgi:hypothetical protein
MKKDEIKLSTSFTSLADMAYNQARTGDLLNTMAQYAKANIAGFPENVTDEGKAELYAGYRLRKAELSGVTKYAIVDNNYLPVTADSEFPENTEYAEIGVAYCFSFTQQQYGQLKSSKPQLYGILKDIREATNDYCSNRLNDLKRYAKEGKAKGKRPQALNFDDWLKSEFVTIRARAKTAKARGEVIDEKKLGEAIVEFNVIWNHDVE